MVKTYSLKKDGEKKLSEHFKVKEFRCKDGTDKILIESGLIDVLEKVHKHFNCSKINISSGYRTPAHDKAVGGKGSGSHTEGKAADFTAYDKNGTPISSKEVALYLEDIGTKGIGYRSGGSSTSTHTDVNYRQNKWFGDEKKSMSASIGSSFYTYLGVKFKKYTATANVNYRTEPGLFGDVAGTVKKGKTVSVCDTGAISRDGYNWVRCKVSGRYYWVAKKYLK